MVTARQDDIDQALGFNFGVNEYLPKPYRTELIILRLQALLKQFKIIHQTKRC